MTFKIIPTLATLCLLTLLLALSNWQWHRSEEKRALLHQQEQATGAATINLSNAAFENAQDLRYRKVQVIGHYDTAHQFLIDNQISSGKPGYFVLTPLLLQGEANAVLVNRGWIPLTQSRSVLPEIPVDRGLVTINGRINKFPSVGVKLAGAEIPTATWPSVVQVVDSGILAKKLGYALFQFQIELDENAPDGFKREWQATTVMSPEQHIAYAVQWLALALTLTALFIWYSFKKND
ncbi:MAG: SURF1 family protein [Methylovulum sp.]|nr:SURF1 family protein [Methylovulum sp.]